MRSQRKILSPDQVKALGILVDAKHGSIKDDDNWVEPKKEGLSFSPFLTLMKKGLAVRKPNLSLTGMYDYRITEMGIVQHNVLAEERGA